MLNPNNEGSSACLGRYTPVSSNVRYADLNITVYALKMVIPTPTENGNSQVLFKTPEQQPMVLRPNLRRPI